MDLRSTPSNKNAAQIDEVQQEIEQLEQRLKLEHSATTLNDLRLRIRFLKWKKDMLQAAYGR